jgi:hypothetical protein
MASGLCASHDPEVRAAAVTRRKATCRHRSSKDYSIADLTLPANLRLADLKRAQAAVPALLARGEINQKDAYNYNTAFKNLGAIFASKTIQDAERTHTADILDVAGLSQIASKAEKEQGGQFTDEGVAGGARPPFLTPQLPNPSSPVVVSSEPQEPVVVPVEPVAVSPQSCVSLVLGELGS